MSGPAMRTRIRPRLPVSLRMTFGRLRHGPRDPTHRFVDGDAWRATLTPAGAATLRLRQRGDEFEAEAWGPGAEHVIATAPDLLGAREDDTGWEPGVHPLIAELDRKIPGLRLPATGAVIEALVPTILEQKVTSTEAHRAWAAMVHRWGEPAPGPMPLRMPPDAARLAREPSFAYHPFGVELKRTQIIRRVCARATRVEEAATMAPEDARQRLEAFPGIGPWSSSQVAQVAWADADAVSVGDFHLAKQVVYAFTGRRGGTDDEMMELLEPFRPYRGRASTLIKYSGLGPPRRGPKIALRDFRRS